MKKRIIIGVACGILAILLALTLIITLNFVVASKDSFVFETKTEVGNIKLILVEVKDGEYVAQLEIAPTNEKKINFTDADGKKKSVAVEDVSILMCDVMVSSFENSTNSSRLHKVLTVLVDKKDGKFVEKSSIQYTPFRFDYNDNKFFIEGKPSVIQGFISNPHMQFSMKFNGESHIFEEKSKMKMNVIDRATYENLKSLG